MKKLATVGLIFICVFVVLFYFSTYHPKDIEIEKVFSSGKEEILKANQKIKVMNWNVQYMAGKNYNFYYDEWDGSGPDVRPSQEDIENTFLEVARVIKAESPDIILLQEIDVGSKRSDYEDQLQVLLGLIPQEYSAYTSSWYWKAWFVPHPKIMGKVGMKLAILSKYRIDRAIRYQLPLMPNNIFVRNLQFKRALLEAVFPIEGGKEISVFTIHQDAFAQGSNTMEEQVALVHSILKERESAGGSWFIAGDFNLLPPGLSYDRLDDAEKPYFQKETEIAVLYNDFFAFPRYQDINGDNAELFFTHFPNYGSKPDRAIDFYFVGKAIKVLDFYVRQDDTLQISDHLPLMLTLLVP